MSARLPNCILFDLDGTVIHSLPGIEHSVRVAFASCRISVGKIDLRGMVGPPIAEILANVGQISDMRVLETLERAFRQNYDSEGWLRTELYPGAAGALEALALAGYRLFVVSNKPRHIAVRILQYLEVA